MELRKDYILDRYVIISERRGERPFEFKKEETKKEGKICFFCPGNEKLTPLEIGRIGSNERWQIRWFANKFYAVEPEGNPIIRTDNRYFTFSDAYGYHEVVVETDDHEKQLADLSVQEIKDVLNVCARRIEDLRKRPHIGYVSVFKNHGRDAGTSLVHSHMQIIAYNRWPSLVKEKLAAIKNYDNCPYCEILNIEKGSDRRCFENDNFVAFTPYASRFHYEIWIFPKEHMKNITDMNDNKLFDLAEILKKIVEKLKSIDAPYNLEFFYSPESENLHFHIEVSPRLAIFAGFEILTNDTINSVSPEDAARFYRGEL